MPDISCDQRRDLSLYIYMDNFEERQNAKAKRGQVKEMASSMISSAPVATASRSPVQAAMVAPVTGFRSPSSLPITKKKKDITSLARNGSKIRCMQVWPPVGKKKFETLSYLPPLTDEQLLKEVQYLINKGWIPCLEFEPQHGFVYRENNRSPGYYDGRYWTMWKLPMFGCTDASQVMSELQETKKAYPESFIRVIGFDNTRQVQCISFIAYKPPGY